MLSAGGDKRLIHLVVCYIVTRFDLDQQYFGGGGKYDKEAKLSLINVSYDHRSKCVVRIHLVWLIT